MKKLVLTTILCVIGLFAYAGVLGEADIKFDKLTHEFGTFSEDDPVVTCKFKFTNTGDELLVIHQAIASCGCTVPDFPIEPIKPGESGIIKVTYDGTHKAPGSLRRSISVHTNAKTEMVKLYITGKMLPRKIDETPVIKVDED